MQNLKKLKNRWERKYWHISVWKGLKSHFQGFGTWTTVRLLTNGEKPETVVSVASIEELKVKSVTDQKEYKESCSTMVRKSQKVDSIHLDVNRNISSLIPVTSWDSRGWGRKSTFWDLPKNIMMIPKTVVKRFCGLLKQTWTFWKVTSCVKTNIGFHKENIMQQSNMGEVVWSGAALLLQDLDHN